MQVSRRLSDGLILQYGDGLGPRDGCETVDLDDTQAQALQDALSDPTIPGVTLQDGVMHPLPAVPPVPPAPPQPSQTELIVQAVLSAPDCPPGVRAAILAAQRAQGV